MALDAVANVDPFEVEKYIVHNMQFFKRWTLNNITLNQLNGILTEKQMMPEISSSAARDGRRISEDGTTSETDISASSAEIADSFMQVINCYNTKPYHP